MLLVFVGAFLVFAVLNAVASDEGARVGVAIGYTLGAIVAFVIAAVLWRRTTRVATD